MSFSSDLADEQWALLEPVFDTSGKLRARHAPNLRRVVDAMLYVSFTGCQWRYLHESFGSWRGHGRRCAAGLATESGRER